MKKILVMIFALIMVFSLSACGEITEADVVGTWEHVGEMYDGEYQEEEYDEAWVGLYVFNEDGTGFKYTGEEGATSSAEITWVLEGNEITTYSATFSDLVDATFMYNEEGKLAKDHSDYASTEGTEWELYYEKR